MRAMIIDGFGGAEAFRIGHLPVPHASAGEVLVRVEYAGINPADWKTREGMLSKYISYHFPFVLGFDLAGVVEAVGEEVRGFSKGERVFGMTKQGTGLNGSYAEFAIADAMMLQLIPPGVDFAAAAAMPVAACTAYGSLIDVGALSEGQNVLINGGAGGVGSYAIQIACAAGARVAVTCSPHNADYVTALGAELAIDYRAGAEAVTDAIASWKPGGVDLVVDAVGLGSLVGAADRLIRPGGRYVEIETLLHETGEQVLSSACQANILIVSNMTAAARIPEHLAGVAALSRAGRLSPPEIETITLLDIPAAHKRLQEGHVRGKIVANVAS